MSTIQKRSAYTNQWAPRRQQHNYYSPNQQYFSPSFSQISNDSPEIEYENLPRPNPVRQYHRKKKPKLPRRRSKAKHHSTRRFDNYGGGEADTDSSEYDTITDCSMYPNNTYTAPFAYACDTSDVENSPPIFVVHEAAFSNETGDYVYPLDFTQTIRIFLDLTSYATRRYDNMRAEVNFYRRKTGWLGCGWMFVPTFGALDSLEVCEEDNKSCPVDPGRQVLEMKMEPNPVLIGFLKMFYEDRNPYEIRVRLINNRQLGEELLCIAFQARIDM